MKDATVLITGAAVGIGRAIAEEVIGAGARAVLWDVDKARLAATAAALGPGVRTGVVDVADSDGVDHESERMAAEGWAPTHLVNNAGIVGRPMVLDDIDPDEVDRVFSINVRGAFVVGSAFLRTRKPHGRAAILNMSSIAARNGGASGHAAYAASKGALSALTAAMASSLAPDIRVNALAPGIIDTEIQNGIYADRAAFERRAASIPMRRAGDAADVARTALWLLFSASYTTGETIRVSGGLS